MPLHDMLVRLEGLPDITAIHAEFEEKGITIGRAPLARRTEIVDWCTEHFSGWAPEVNRSFERDPIACFVAWQSGALVGFAAYDTNYKNFFGPTAVLEEMRGKGIGRALLLTTLAAQREQGYRYSIIGAVGPAEFYEKAVGALLLEWPAALHWDS